MGEKETSGLYRRLRDKFWFRWAMDLGIIALIFFAFSAYQTRNLIDRSAPLPPATLISLDGEELSFDDLNQRRTVIYFWATWCGACSLQSGAISSLHSRAEKREDLEVISVVLHYQSEEQVRAFVKENQIDYPVYLGTPGVAASFNIDIFPTVYIVDSERRVRHGLAGYTTGLGLRARLLL